MPRTYHWYILIPVYTGIYYTGMIPTPAFGHTPYMVYAVSGRWGDAAGTSARETARGGAGGELQPRGEGAGRRRSAVPRGPDEQHDFPVFSLKKKYIFSPETKTLYQVCMCVPTAHSARASQRWLPLPAIKLGATRSWATRSRRRGAGAHSRGRPRPL